MARSRKRVLWIEDKTQLELAYLVPPVLLDGHYHLEVARNATETVRLLAETPYTFDMLIFDLDLPPGDWEDFAAFYRRFERRGEEPAMLGLELLAFVRRNRGVRKTYAWKEPLRSLLSTLHHKYRHTPLAVFSIYTDLQRDRLVDLLDLTTPDKAPLRDALLVQKRSGMPRTALLHLLRTLEKQWLVP